jgi:sulfopyruvate decarboxylase alpha subunit
MDHEAPRQTLAEPSTDWPRETHAVLRRAQVRQVAYVPDAGLSELIALTHDDPEMTVSVLTTEEEGIGVLAGAWLGGQRGALLMQSSGVGNCLNMLALVKTCRFPLLTIVTMRGEWAEFNPWQVPMGQATGRALELMDVLVYRVDAAEAVAETVAAAADLAFQGDVAVAVLLSQKLIGRKVWTR